MYTQKELTLMDTYVVKLHLKIYFPSIKNLVFICHMCSSWVPITVEKNYARHFSTEGIIKIKMSL